MSRGHIRLISITCGAAAGALEIAYIFVRTQGTPIWFMPGQIVGILVGIYVLGQPLESVKETQVAWVGAVVNFAFYTALTYGAMRLLERIAARFTGGKLTAKS